MHRATPSRHRTSTCQEVEEEQETKEETAQRAGESDRQQKLIKSWTGDAECRKMTGRQR